MMSALAKLTTEAIRWVALGGADTHALRLAVGIDEAPSRCLQLATLFAAQLLALPMWHALHSALSRLSHKPLAPREHVPLALLLALGTTWLPAEMPASRAPHDVHAWRVAVLRPHVRKCARDYRTQCDNHPLCDRMAVRRTKYGQVLDVALAVRDAKTAAAVYDWRTGARRWHKYQCVCGDAFNRIHVDRLGCALRGGWRIVQQLLNERAHASSPCRISILDVLLNNKQFQLFFWTYRRIDAALAIVQPQPATAEAQRALADWQQQSMLDMPPWPRTEHQSFFASPIRNTGRDRALHQPQQKLPVVWYDRAAPLYEHAYGCRPECMRPRAPTADEEPDVELDAVVDAALAEAQLPTSIVHEVSPNAEHRIGRVPIPPDSIRRAASRGFAPVVGDAPFHPTLAREIARVIFFHAYPHIPHLPHMMVALAYAHARKWHDALTRQRTTARRHMSAAAKQAARTAAARIRAAATSTRAAVAAARTRTTAATPTSTDTTTTNTQRRRTRRTRSNSPAANDDSTTTTTTTTTMMTRSMRRRVGD
jgi:hypothetical protein